MLRRAFCLSLSVLCLTGCSSTTLPTPADLQAQVFSTEQAFAQTMAARDLQAFSGFIADEAVFFSEDKARRGKEAIVAAWRPLFVATTAPFSWKPAHVEVLDSGGLALSTGPVTNAHGDIVATFSSIWRRAPDGQWQIVFDKGNDVCNRCVSEK